MSEEQREMKCHDCDGVMVRDTEPAEFTYKGRTITVDQPGWYCQNCEEAVLDGADILATEPALADFRARIDGILTAEEIKAARKRLGLTQKEAGELLGGGPRAFQKYESRKEQPSRAMSNLLRLATPEQLVEKLGYRPASKQ